ncbi:MAG: ParB N-terminal domain-containing protein [Defluviitaleaceae bacterium]|nr:ParB N-terminal domain-containing protein [Defluviitaleaceae bacterium]
MAKSLKRPKSKTVDNLFQLGEAGGSAGENPGITHVKVDELLHYSGSPLHDGKHFNEHPFKLYTGERLEDMVESIRANGVLVPIIVNKQRNEELGTHVLTILAGHNRTEAAKLAGLTEIPAVILEEVSDEKAAVIVVETNLMQRSFSDMAHSEKAAVVVIMHSKMFSQGKRNDILAQLKALDGDNEENEAHAKLRTDEAVGLEYGLSRSTIARYLRIHKLEKCLKFHLDDGVLGFIPAVEVSFLKKKTQQLLGDCLDDGCKINLKSAGLIRKADSEGTVNRWVLEEILLGKAFDPTGPPPIKPRKIKVRGDVYSKYFTDRTDEEVESIVEEALNMYFESR